MGAVMSDFYGSGRPGNTLGWVAAIVAALIVVGTVAAVAVTLLPQSSPPRPAAGSPHPAPGYSSRLAVGPSGSPSASPVGSKPEKTPPAVRTTASQRRTVAAGAAKWTYPVLADGQVDSSNGGQINAVSCPSAVTCYAVDNQGNILAWTSGEWKVANSPVNGSNLSAISCASAEFCVAITSSDAIVLSDGSWNDPVIIDPANRLNDVSCPSPTFCLAVDSNGQGYLFTGSVTRWSPVLIDENQHNLTGVSCPETSFCVAVDDSGDAYTYQNGTWTADPNADEGSSFSSVSCASASFCVALDGNGNPVTNTGGAWSTYTYSGKMQSISCPANGYCFAVDDSGGVLYYRNGSWTGPTKIDGNDTFATIDCSALDACVAIDQDGNVMYYGPTG
jgi:hypothetical protein